MTFQVTASDGSARAGVLHTAHGEVETPQFMPVGTRGAVRTLDPRDLEEVGARVILGNTYHLMLRPGDDTIAALGGLHAFSGWSGPILTDSGGYQVFSLSPDITEDGATFRSTYDGTTVHMTPEYSIAVQQRLGSDIAMVFDELIGLPADREAVEAAMERTLRWSQRALAAHTRDDQQLFGIVQGGVDPELRAASARRTAELGFAGFGIGGLSVGESAAQRDAAIDACVPELPAGAVRYVMGLGDTEGVLAAVERGCDLFDCVWPTRLARHGKVLTDRGDYSIKRAEHAADARPLQEQCECRTCAFASRAYLRHLRLNEPVSAMRLLSIHNLHYTLGVMDRIRGAIAAGRFAQERAAIESGRASGTA